MERPAGAQVDLAFRAIHGRGQNHFSRSRGSVHARHTVSGRDDEDAFEHQVDRGASARRAVVAARLRGDARLANTYPLYPIRRAVLALDAVSDGDPEGRRCQVAAFHGLVRPGFY